MAYPEKVRLGPWTVTTHDGDLGIATWDTWRRFAVGLDDTVESSILGAFDWLYDRTPANLAEAYAWANGTAPPESWYSQLHLGSYVALETFERTVKARAASKPKPLTPRSLAQWDRLAKRSRWRWERAYGKKTARQAYVEGRHLTAAQRGHADTPSSPSAALADPVRWWRYLDRHKGRWGGLQRAALEALLGAVRIRPRDFEKWCHIYVISSEKPRRPRKGAKPARRHGGV